MCALWLKSFLKDYWKYNINSYRSFSSSLSLCPIPIPYFLSIFKLFLTLHLSVSYSLSLPLLHSLCVFLSLAHTHSHLFLSIQDLMVNYFNLNGVSYFADCKISRKGWGPFLHHCVEKYAPWISGLRIRVFWFGSGSDLDIEI